MNQTAIFRVAVLPFSGGVEECPPGSALLEWEEGSEEAALLSER